MANPIHRLYRWVLGWAESPYATPALFALAASEAIFFPVPPDVLLIAMVLGSRSRWLKDWLTCSVGSVLGGLAGYAVGAAFSGTARGILAFYEAEAQADRLAEIFSSHSFLAIWLAGFTPIPYKVFTITAGLCHEQIGVWTLLAASATSRPLRFLLVALLVAWWGEPAKRFVERYFNLLTLLVGIGVIAGFVGMAIWGNSGRHGEGAPPVVPATQAVQPDR